MDEENRRLDCSPSVANNIKKVGSSRGLNYCENK